jgi:signal transduction histidine kinase
MDARVLILAPRGRDAAIASELFRKHGVAATICENQAALMDKLEAGAGAVLLTEEALAAGQPQRLESWVAAQASWSDMPFIVLANGARTPRTALATARLTSLGNVVMLERPLHADAMLGAVRSALKARQRQYEVRDASAGLEKAVVDRTRDLQSARESLEIALDAAGMGSWDIDLFTGESRRTQRHDEIFGYADAPLKWDIETFMGHVPEAERDIASAAFDTALTTGNLELECGIVGADGTHRWIVTKGRVLYDDGRPARISGVVSDVTERKETDAQLAQAQKMDAIGQLTGGVAHDFNNLLTPIVGSLDLIRRRHADDERTQRMVSGALQAAERAATLTQRLLSFARRQALQPKAVDVKALVDGIVDLIRRSLGPSITVVLELPNDMALARVDPNQLELALLNLAINARDAMPGGGRLTISAGETVVDSRNAAGLEPGTFVRLVTADTGTGMDRATLARAIDPFFSTKGVGKGTGLGLSMVHGLAAQSEGTLKLSSTPGIGTEVELWLPATGEVAADAELERPEPSIARRAATVLLVDDEELVRTSTAEMLRDVGYTVIEVGSASQALRAIRSGIAVDVLVSDYLMPGMTGGELITELRAAGKRIPALLVTGYAAAGLDVPSDVARLAKPFRQVDLAAHVDALLRPASNDKPGLQAM